MSDRNGLVGKLTEMQTQKDNYIIPENIKKGVTVLGVTGTYEGSGESGVKLFDTVEQMQADPNPKEGDLAIVFGSKFNNCEVNSIFSKVYFPEVVELSNVFEDYVDLQFRAVDTSKMFDCYGSIDSTMFNMSCHSEDMELQIEYQSEDGIIYNRTQFTKDYEEITDDIVDFGCDIHYSYPEYWNDVIGSFIQIPINTFDGIYRYGKNTNVKYINSFNIETGVESDTFEIPNQFFGKDNGNNPSMVIIKTYHYDSNKDVNIIDTCDFIPSSNVVTSFFDGSVWHTGNEIYIGAYFGYNDETNPITIYSYDFVNNTEAQTSVIPSEYKILGKTSASGSVCYYALYELTSNLKVIPIGSYLPYSTAILTTISNPTSSTVATNYIYVEVNSVDKMEYILCDLPLDADAEDVYGKTFYGINGVQVGTLNVLNDLTKAQLINRVKIYSKLQDAITITDTDLSNLFYNIEGIENIVNIPPNLDTSNVINMSGMFSNCQNLVTIPLLDTSNVTDMSNMFYSCINLEEVPLLDTSNVTDMRYMFYNCDKLATIPLLDTSNVTSMNNMFLGCENLEEVPLLDTSNVTNMSNMFTNCDSLTTIPTFNTQNVTNMSSMFYNCDNLTTMPLLDTSSVTNMSSMFYNCINLTTMSLLDTSNVTDMSDMFYGCKVLTTIPQLNTSSVTNMSRMFSRCEKLTTVPQLDTSSVTNMSNMFYKCDNLTTMSQLNTSNVTDMSRMFNDCVKLTTVQLDLSSARNVSYLFSNCTKLNNVTLLNVNSITNVGYMFNNCSALVTAPQFDTSNLGSMIYVFSGCSSLKNVPVYDTSKVNFMNSVFSGCSSLTTESLNNILLMCINSVPTADWYKTLKYIGLSSSQATACRNLSNWSAFTSAGWTTGY